MQYRVSEKVSVQGVSLGPELPEHAGGLLGGNLAVVLHSHRDLLKLNTNTLILSVFCYSDVKVREQ